MIESVTGNAYADELRRRILEPLGMNGTGLVDHREPLEDVREQAPINAFSGAIFAAF